MDEATEMLVDALIVAEEAGASINWAGADFPCSAGPEMGGKMLGMGGYRVTAQETIVVRNAVFPEGTGLPLEKQLLSFTSAPGEAAKALRIDSLTGFRGAFLVLECNGRDQAA
jgi:hypothetical protein